MRKYKLRTDLTINYNGTILYRIEALIDFGNVKKGDIGGYIEKEENLSHNGNCWIYDDAKVFGNAWVFGKARVSGDALVSGKARVSGDALVSGDAWVYGNAQVFGNAWVYDNAQVSGNARVYHNPQVFGNALISGDAWVYGYSKVKEGEINSGYHEYLGNKTMEYLYSDS